MKKNFAKWAKAALIRGVKTFGQTAASLITIGATLKEIDVGYVLSVAAVALIYSLLTSIGGLPEVPNEDAE